MVLKEKALVEIHEGLPVVRSSPISIKCDFIPYYNIWRNAGTRIQSHRVSHLALTVDRKLRKFQDPWLREYTMTGAVMFAPAVALVKKLEPKIHCDNNLTEHNTYKKNL